MRTVTSHLAAWTRTVMLAAPLFPIGVGIIVGIVVDEAWRPWAAWYYAAFAVSAATILVRPARRAVGPWLIALASAGIGGMLHLHAARTLDPSGIERCVGDRQRLLRVRGEVADEPRVVSPPPTEFQSWMMGSDRTVFLLDVESIEGVSGDIPSTGRLRVSVGEPLLDLRQGERVEVFGRLYPFPPPANPGAFDWASFNRRSGVGGGMFCDQRENVHRFPTANDAAERWLPRLRARLRAMLTDDLVTGSGAEASLLEAMILGHRSRVDRQLNDTFVRAGCVHFLAVSGVNVVIVMGFVRILCAIVRLGPRLTTTAMIVAVVLFAAVAEPRPPILRASVIGLIYCLARLLGRERAYLNWISATVILLAIIDPDMVFDIGYQLSTTAVLGVSYLAPALRGAAVELRTAFETRVLRRPFASEDRRLARSATVASSSWGRAGRRAWDWTGRWISTGLAVSLGAWLASLPIIAVYFMRVQPWGAISSLVALPLVSGLMLMGFVKLAALALAPALGSWVTVALTHTNAALVFVVERLSQLPGANAAVSPPPWWVIVPYYAVLLALIRQFPSWALVNDGPAPLRPAAVPENRAPRRWLAAGGAVLLLSLVAWIGLLHRGGRLTVTVLSVGAGSAALIEFPNGDTWLFDAGSASGRDVAASVIEPSAHVGGIRRIDRVYLSHPNLDHVSAVPGLIEAMPVGPILVNEYFEPRSPPRSPSHHLLKLLKERGKAIETAPATPGDFQCGGVRVERLWPPAGLDASVPTNDTSTVMRLTFAGRSILLTGDIEDFAQESLVERGGLRADVLVLPHHGSVRPSTRPFLDAVGASILIRSSGEPMAETYNGLENIVGDRAILNTADVGAVRATVTPDGAGPGRLDVAPYRRRRQFGTIIP